MSGIHSHKGRLPILMVNMFIAMLGIGLIIPVLPEYLKEFGASGKEAGTLVAAFGLTQFLFSPLAGKWSDRFGRKKLIVLGLFLFSIANLIFATAQELWMLYASRFINGIGSAMMVPSMMAYVADITTLEKRGKGLGLLGASMSLGFVIGPGIGGFLAEIGVRAPFYVSTGVGVVALLVSLTLLPETLTPEMREQLLKMKVKGDHVFKQLVRSFKAPYWIYLFLVFTLTFGLANFEAIYSLYVDKKFGFTAMHISVLITVGALMGVIIQSLLIDRLLKRFGEKKLIHFGFVASAITILMMLMSGNFFWVMLVTMMFFTFTSILRPAINTLLSKQAGDEQGFVAGMNNAYMSLGNIFGPTVAGLLFDYHIDSPYLFGAIVLVGSFVLSVLWGKQNRDRVIEA